MSLSFSQRSHVWNSARVSGSVVNSLFKANGLGKPNQIDMKNGGSLPATGGFIAHAHVGRNGHPLAKLADLDATLRGGPRRSTRRC